MNKVQIKVKLEDESLELPHYATEGAAGADVRAHLQEDYILEPGESALIPTGISYELPEGFEMQVRPRSGLAFKNKVTVLNAPGTLDSDYRGELKILLINHGKEAFTITPQMRIAQIIIAPVCQATFSVQKSLLATQRGEGGFGHTGTK